MTSSITVQQIQVQMKTSKTCPLIAYYMLRDGLDYPAAVEFYRHHNHYLDILQWEQLALQEGYDIHDAQKFDPAKWKKFSVKLGQVESELTEPEVKLLLDVDYNGLRFNIPTDADVSRAHVSCDPMLMYGWTEEETAARAWEVRELRSRDIIARMKSFTAWFMTAFVK